MSIDPLAALVEAQEQLRDRLLETPTDSEELQAAWQAAAAGLLAEKKPPRGFDDIPSISCCC
jgi:hypothetical protein